jgi:hypothetical protein
MQVGRFPELALKYQPVGKSQLEIERPVPGAELRNTGLINLVKSSGEEEM